MRLHMATLMSLLPIAMVCGLVVLLFIYRRQPSALHTIRRLATSPQPVEKPTGHWTSPNLGSLTITHPIATSSLQPSISNNNLHLLLHATMPAAEICCLNPPTRSLSPTEPARPPPLSLDGIFAVAALPNDHPHSLKIHLPDRRPPKQLIRSPSFANKLKGQLRRRATVKSLKAEVCGFDGDARELTSGEIGGIQLPTLTRAEYARSYLRRAGRRTGPCSPPSGRRRRTRSDGRAAGR